MIKPSFTGTVPPRAEITLRCDRLDCDAAFAPRDAYWNRDDLRDAAAREAAWTRDEVGRDHCGHHRSTYAARCLQEDAEATYPEATSSAMVTSPDPIIVPAAMGEAA